jgi:hypothetical protein
MNPIFLEYSILFLQRATSYDGGDDEGGSIVGLLESIDNIWWPLVGIVLLFLAIKSIFTEVFVDKPREREYHRKFNLDYPTIEDKQRYYDKRFSTEKLEVEKKWEKESRRYDFDITNKAHYCQRITRDIVRVDYSSEKGYKLLKEYWTYDGEWRQGYWNGKFDYKDMYWESNTICDVLDLTKGDIQPKISTTPSNQKSSPIKETKDLKQNIFLNETTNQDDGDDLPF